MRKDRLGFEVNEWVAVGTVSYKVRKVVVVSVGNQRGLRDLVTAGRVSAIMHASVVMFLTKMSIVIACLVDAREVPLVGAGS